LHDRGLAVTVFHTDLRAPDLADYPSDYHYVSVPVTVPTELVASEDTARLVTELNVSCATPFQERLAALLGEEEEGGVRCVITDVIWYSAQAAARELGVPELPELHEEHKDDPVDVLPPFRVRDLQRIETSSLADFASLLGHTVDGARQSTCLINTFEAIEAVDLDNIREDMSTPVFAIGPLHKFAPPVKSSLDNLQQDRRCLDWLDTQAPGSVIHVSFGSLAARVCGACLGPG
ncbi:DIMBOA UDP-glucosyltransferase BX8, partial [Dichanthelium oligosanthes]